MLLRTLFFIFILCLPISVSAQEEYTIPKKHRVIQESSTKPKTVEVDTKIAGIEFTSLTEITYRSDNLLKQGPIVFVFLSTECPVAQRYAMRLKRMYAEFKKKGLTIVGVYANENDSIEKVKAYLTKAEYTFPVVKDIDGSIARHLGATMTPQAHLIDTFGVLRYRGPIDDNRYVTRVKQEYLKDALSSILEGKPVPVKEAPAFGCTIHFPEIPKLTEINYAEHIAPIIRKNCQSCHHEVGLAPFILQSYEDVKSHADNITKQTQARLMPPWRTVAGHGDFKNERRLTDSEIELIEKWVRNGAASGTIGSEDLTGQHRGTWKLVEPDVTLTKNIVYKSLPKGKRASIKTLIDTPFNKERYIRGISFQSKKSKTVRQITASIRSQTELESTLLKSNNGIGRKTTDESKNNIDLRIGIWAPGIQPTVLPDKTGYLLPKGGKITLNILYQGSGREEHDTLKIGLYFSDSPGTVRIYKSTLMKNRVLMKNRIGVGDKSNEKKRVLSYKFQDDSYVIAVEPIILVKDQELKIVAITPSDEEIKMIWLNEFHFDWLDVYHYLEPVFLPAGTRLEFEFGDGSKSDQVFFVLHLYYTKVSEYTVD